MQPLLLLLGFGLLYGFTHAQFHTYDALSYVNLQIHPNATSLFHPHHLFTHATLLGWDRLWRFLGYTGDYFLPAQTLNTIACVLSLLFFYHLINKITKRPAFAFLITAALGLSYGFWFDAVEVEVYALPLPFLVLAMNLILRDRDRPKPASTFLAALSLGIAGTFHELAFFTAPAWVLLFFFHRRLSAAQKILQITLFSLGISLVGAGSYLAVSRWILGHRSFSETLTWMTGYLHVMPHNFSVVKIYWAPYGLFETFFGHYLIDTFRTGKMSALHWILFLIPPVLFLEFFRRVLFHTSWKKIWHNQREAALGMMLPLLTTGSFILKFGPQVSEWWQITLPFFWGFMAIALNKSVILRPKAEESRNKILRFAQDDKVWLAGICVLLFGVNLFGTFLPARNLENDYEYKEAKTLADLSNPEDFFLVTFGNTEWYLKLFLNRQDVQTVHNIGLRNRSEKPKIFAGVRQRLLDAVARNRKIFISGEALETNENMLTLHGITREEYERFWAPYRPYLKPVASYQNLSLNRVMGLRVGRRDYNIYELTALPVSPGAYT